MPHPQSAKETFVHVNGVLSVPGALRMMHSVIYSVFYVDVVAGDHIGDANRTREAPGELIQLFDRRIHPAGGVILSGRMCTRTTMKCVAIELSLGGEVTLRVGAIHERVQMDADTKQRAGTRGNRMKRIELRPYGPPGGLPGQHGIDGFQDEGLDSQKTVEPRVGVPKWLDGVMGTDPRA